MRRVLWLALTASAFAQYNGNAPRIVQSYIDPSFSGAHGSLTFQEPVSSGNLEFVCIAVDKGVNGGSGGPYTLSSGNVPAWTASSVLHYSTLFPSIRHSFDFQCFHGAATSSGSETVTAGGTGGAVTESTGAEITNAVDVVDVSGSQAVNSTTPSSISVPLTTTIDGDFVIGASATSAGQGAADCGWVSSPSYKVNVNFESIPFSFGSIMQANPLAAHGSITLTRNSQGCSSSDNPSDGLAMFAYAFKPVSSGVKVATTLMANCDTLHPYQSTLAALGGSGSKTWAVSAGSLPAGLSLSSGGVISGTCSGTAGTTSNFTAQVTDGTSATQALSISVVPPFASPSVSSIQAGTADLSLSVNGLRYGDAILVLASGFDTHATGGWMQPVSGATNNIVDSFGSAFYRVCPGSDGFNAPIVAYVAKSLGSGNDIITFNQSITASNLTWFAIGINGGSYVVDCGSNANGAITGGTSTTLSTSITTQVPNELLIGFNAGAIPQSDNWGGGFTKLSSISFSAAASYGAVATATSTTAGSYSASDTITLASANNYIGGLMLIGIRPDQPNPITTVGEKFRRQIW